MASQELNLQCVNNPEALCPSKVTIHDQYFMDRAQVTGDFALAVLLCSDVPIDPHVDQAKGRRLLDDVDRRAKKPGVDCLPTEECGVPVVTVAVSRFSRFFN